MNIWPVIHISDLTTAQNNMSMAQNCGVAGVFLIHMDGDDDRLDNIAIVLQQQFPHMKIGVNYLSQSPQDALMRSIKNNFDATWVDGVGLWEDEIPQQARDLSALAQEFPNHLVFVGVAFKYQKTDNRPWLAARNALDLGFIPTTSGVGTGYAIESDKLTSIRRDMHEMDRLGLASGVTPDNINTVRSYVSDVLVSTGISKTFHEFDEQLLQRLCLGE